MKWVTLDIIHYNYIEKLNSYEGYGNIKFTLDEKNYKHQLNPVFHLNKVINSIFDHD